VRADVAGGRRGGAVTDVAGDVVEGHAVLAHRGDHRAPADVRAEPRRVDAERSRPGGDDPDALRQGVTVEQDRQTCLGAAGSYRTA